MKKPTTLLLGAALILGTVGMGLAADEPKTTTPAPVEKTKPVIKRHKRSKKAGQAAVKTPATPATPYKYCVSAKFRGPATPAPGTPRSICTPSALLETSGKNC